MNQTPFYYVLTIEEERSLSKAAKKLGISQPALSAYLSKLESKLQGQIFDRSVLPLEITDFGRVYLDYVKESYNLEVSFDRRVDDLNNLQTGKIVIGGANSFTSCYLPEASSAFLKKYPGISVRIVDARVPELTQMAIDGELDFFIADKAIADESLKMEQFLTERILICVPPEWKLNAELSEYRIPESDIMDGSVVTRNYEKLPLSALASQNFVLLEEDLRVRRIAEEFFATEKFTPARTVLVGQIMTSLALTNAGVGVSFMSDKTIRYSNLHKLPAMYAFNKSISLREMAAIYKKDRYISRACREYLKILHDTFS